MTGWTALPEVPARDMDLAMPVLDMLPARMRPALARCAMVGVFDTEMYTEVLRAKENVELDQLVRFDVITELPGGDEKYCVRTGLREVAWRAWLADQPEADAVPALHTFGEQLSAYCRPRGLGVERLRALLLVDDARARAAFAEEFDVCAERMDIAGCRNLLDVLTDPMLRPFVSNEMITLRNTKRRALSAREILRRTFLGSARYLHRPALELQLATMLDGSSHRGLRLQGSGGHGKSTLLNWFISRQCVPEGIPCALVDLDTVDPVNATRHPFLVVLEIAHQLNGQIEGAPFEELLREHGFYRPILTRQASGSGSAVLGTVKSEVDAEDVSYRFLSVLHEVTGTTPVLIVLDTFEEAALRPAGDARALVETLIALHDGDDAVRLVLSGRHTKAEGGIGSLAGRMSACEVTEFSPAESFEYLTVTRGLKRDDLVPAIVAAARGVPWQVALFADVVEQYPSITSDLLKTLDPGVAWAVDRVVGRVGDSLQWLIRYGTVPRRLSKDFAGKVILPRMEQSMAGSEVDRPEQDAIPPEAIKVFRTGGAPGELDDLWTSLTQYAATTSWMWIAPNDEDAVVFHPAVREPMRRLVAAQPVCDLLHQDAIACYEDLAERDDSSPVWTGEALYHRFQLMGTQAATYWRGAIEDAWHKGRPDWVASIAGEILGPEYVDEDGNPLAAPSGVSLVDADLIAAAHAEQAWAVATMAYGRDLPSGDMMWSQVETSLTSASRLPGDDASTNRMMAAQATLLVARGQPGKAVALLAPITKSELLSPAERLAVLMVTAGALSAVSGPGSAHATLQEAWEIAERQGLARQQVDIAVLLADVSVQRGHLDEAAFWMRRVDKLDPTPQSARLDVRISLELGRPEKALAQAKAGAEQVKALTALGRPAEAVTLCTQALGVTSEPAARADLLVLRAVAYADLLECDQALTDLLQAQSTFFQVSDIEGVGMTCAHAAQVQLEVIGNLNDAQHHLDVAGRLLLPPGSPAWLRCRLLRAELLRRRGHRADAQRIATKALEAVADSVDPRPAVEAALGMLIAAPRLAARAFQVLDKHLPHIQPATARLLALSSLYKCPARDWGERLLSAVCPTGAVRDIVSRHQGSELEGAWLGLRMAELLRVAGRPAEAVDLAAWSASQFPFLAWNLLGLAYRAGIPARRDPLAWFEEISDNAFALRTAAGALMIADLNSGMDGIVPLVEAAGSALDSATTRISRWHWLLFDLRKRLARDAEAVRNWDLRAIATLADLGEREQRAGADLAPEVARREVRLDISLDSTGALVVVGDGTTLLRMEPNERLVAALHEESDRRAKSPIVRTVRDALREDRLLAVSPLPVLPDGFDLRIIAEPPLAQLPWELVTVGGVHPAELPGVRVVYRGLLTSRKDQVRTRVLQEALTAAGVDPGPLDGYLGPLTKRAVSLLQYQHGLEVDGAAGPETWQTLRARAGRTPNVLILRRRFALEAASERGYSNVGGEDLAGLYRRTGWDVHLASGSDVRGIDEVLPADVRVDVLHVNASVEVSRSVPYLEFGASSLGWSEDVTVTDLDHLVYQLSLHGHTPLVVLDVTAPPQFSSETVRHLLLRNDFAHQLLMLGRAHSVLATGLATEATAARGQHELVEELAGAGTPADVVYRLHQRSADQRRRTALFTALRPDLMPGVR